MSFLLSLFIFLSSQQGKKIPTFPSLRSLSRFYCPSSLPIPSFQSPGHSKSAPFARNEKKRLTASSFANLSMTVEIIFFVGQDIFSAPREWEIFLEKKEEKKSACFSNFLNATLIIPSFCTVFCSITTLFLVFTLVRNYPCKGEIISRVGIFFR